MTSQPQAPYPYPLRNVDLIKFHNLEKHFEGGYFAQTVSLESVVPESSKSVSNNVPVSAALGGRLQTASGSGTQLLASASGTRDAEISEKQMDATQIYYLLTPSSYRGRMHMNLHATFHVHHAGRALYTLIRPPTDPSELPLIKKVVMGSDPSAGEVLQLFVPGGWWKASEIPEEDLNLSKAITTEHHELEDRIGCLISEVVVPGWNPDQHQFIDEEKLKAMWGGQSGWEQYEKYIKAPEGLEYPSK